MPQIALPAVAEGGAGRGASFPIAYRLYLPKDWAADPARRKKAGVPEEVTFRTKPEIALDQIRAALEAGAHRGRVFLPLGGARFARRRLDARQRHRRVLLRREAGAGLSITACQTPQQSAGTATGVVAGAVVGGPVGAVVGGVAGAAAIAPGGPLSPGYCYVQNRRGQLIYDRAGRPLVRRCA